MNIQIRSGPTSEKALHLACFRRYPEIGGDSWVGVLVPAGTPKGIIGLLNREVVKIVMAPDMKARLEELGYDPVASTPEEFAIRIKVEIETWAKVIRAAHIKTE